MRILLTVGALLAVISCSYYLSQRNQDTESIGDFSRWEPTQKEIAIAVGKESAGTFRDQRHRTFARMFQERFRRRSVVVGLRFTGENRVMLMCGAVIPRWDMARVGVEAYHETRSVFGKTYDVDIYETYIASYRRKIAEVRAGTAAGRLAVTFSADYRQETRPERTRRGQNYVNDDQRMRYAAALLQMALPASPFSPL